MNNEQHPQQPDIKTSKRISPLWILPLVTLLLTGWLIYKTVNGSGEMVNIYFDDAQGLIAGRTPIRYQGLEIGMVNKIKLDKKSDSIYVEAEVYPEAKYLLNAQTQFWLVKPSASLSGVSGLDALVSGNYIELLPSDIDDDSDVKAAYYALKNPPTTLQNTNDLIVNLTSQDLGGINIGSQILYKKIPIGEVFGYRLASDSQSVLIQASVKEEFKSLITDKSRFWNVSGINANINLSNIDIQLENLASLLTGAISVDSPDNGQPIESGHEYKLYKDIRSAGRGVHIKVELPINHGLIAQSSSVLYKDMKIGQVLDIEFNKDKSKVIANVAIQPAFSDMLVSGSRFIIDQAQVSLTNIQKLSNIIKGNDLILIPNTQSHAAERAFTAIREVQYKQQADQSVTITLLANSTKGLSEGSVVRYKGIPVGAVSNVLLTGDKVRITAYINKQYSNLVRSKNKFYVNTTTTASLSDNGLDITVSPISDIITGGISFISEGTTSVPSSYQLYDSEAAANLAKTTADGSKRIQLVAPSLPAIKANAPVLYHNIKVGRVENYRLTTSGVNVSVLIDNQYQHLISANSVFWGISGFEMDASINGVKLKSNPLESILKGGIEFDTVSGIKNKLNGQYRLFTSLDDAKQYGKLITLLAPDSHGITKGTPILFKGVSVGKVSSVTPDFKDNNVVISAYILPEYQGQIAKTNSYFWFGNRNANLVDSVKDIKNLIQPAIQVYPGRKGDQSTYTLHDTPYQEQGMTLVLQSANKNSVAVNMPVTYRGINVGKVTRVQLGELADRVLVYLNIDNKYRYLVRENSIFWNETGVDMSVGLTGADIRTGSLQSLMTGGIAFNTPETSTLAPAAKNNDTYLLQQQKNPDWQSWNQPIPKP